MSAEHLVVGDVRGYLILHRLLRNEILLPGQVQIGYVVAETTDNLPASLVQATTLLQQQVIEKIAFPNPLPPYDYGYPDPDYCERILSAAGVQEDQIITISPAEHLPKMNTQTELAMLAEYIEKTGYQDNLIIVAPWFHLLRSFLTALSEFKNAKLDTKVFVSSVSLNPYEETTHSQGIQKGTGRKIFDEEIEKCRTYKNLISIEEAMKIYRQHRGLISG